MLRLILSACLAVTLSLPHRGFAAETLSAAEAENTLRRGVEYFRSTVSIQGGYLWRYSADFSEREGEVPASPTTAWVQPWGTPSVGGAYLRVYELTGDETYLAAARETALALVHGQLISGGWDYRIEFADKDRAKYAYRVDVDRSRKNENRSSLRNTTTLDDNTTQAALSFLMRVDRALNFQDVEIHESVAYALKSLLAAQYPNGAWPQRFDDPPDPEKFPVKQAAYPADWPRTYPKQDYRSYYTFNDNTIADMIELMFLASDVYNEPKYVAAAERAGEFILLAQMPEPQPGWAQQYNAEMHPAWARKFEPASITGGESQGVMQTLLRLYELTGKRKYLEPLPRALAYFRRSLLPDGRLARFYELRTNKPLYFTKDYRVTYSDDDLPTHYGFKSGNKLNRIAARLQMLETADQNSLSNDSAKNEPRKPKMTGKLAASAEKIVQSQNQSGAWVEPAPDRKRSKIAAGTPSLSTRTFVRNITTLAEYIAATKQQ